MKYVDDESDDKNPRCYYGIEPYIPQWQKDDFFICNACGLTYCLDHHKEDLIHKKDIICRECEMCCLCSPALDGECENSIHIVEQNENNNISLKQKSDDENTGYMYKYSKENLINVICSIEQEIKKHYSILEDFKDNMINTRLLGLYICDFEGCIKCDSCSPDNNSDDFIFCDSCHLAYCSEHYSKEEICEDCRTCNNCLWKYKEDFCENPIHIPALEEEKIRIKKEIKKELKKEIKKRKLKKKELN